MSKRFNESAIGRVVSSLSEPHVDTDTLFNKDGHCVMFVGVCVCVREYVCFEFEYNLWSLASCFMEVSFMPLKVGN